MWEPHDPEILRFTGRMNAVISPHPEASMDDATLTFLRKPSALVPLLVSLAALALVLVHAALYGIVHEADEGAAAHIWQILIVFDGILAFAFAVHWWNRARRQTLLVLALLAATTAANFAAVFFLT
jgi:hypothetical protein